MAKLSRGLSAAFLLVVVLVLTNFSFGTVSHPRPVALYPGVLAADMHHNPRPEFLAPAPPVAIVAPPAAPVVIPPPPVVHYVAPPVRPAPPPPPPAPPAASGGSVQSIIIAAAGRWGVSSQQLLNVARCESGFNIYAHNASGATGLFQFMPRTFYGNGGHDLYSAYDQSDIAAKMFAHGQAGQWVCRG